MELVDVASVDELDEGRPRIVRIGRREIALVQWRGRVFAFRNRCPHQSQSFDSGIVSGRIVAGDRPGEMHFRNDEPVLLCPWHRWEFDLDTGRCPLVEKMRVRTYPTVVDGSRVLVDFK